MNYYYYPLTSRDFTFENIFSSESISPPCIYNLRTFGTDFFNTIPNLHHPEAIVLYTQPPQYDSSKEPGDYIKFIVKIAEKALDPNEIISISEDMIGYQKTIYLDCTNFELLFFSQKELTICCLKSEAALSTKSYRKYESNFKIIDSKDCRDFNTAILETLTINKSWNEVIDFDRKFNFFKGFCYGLLCGLLKTLSKKETELKRSLQDITNRFSEFKNKSTDDTKKKYDRNLIKEKPAKEIDATSKVLNSINNAEQLFKAHIPGIEFKPSKVEEYLKDLFLANGFQGDHINLFIQIKKMEDLVLGTSNFTKFKSQYLKSDHQNPILYFEFLREQTQAFASQLNSATDWAKTSRDKASDSFKKTMYDLSKVADAQAAKPGPSDASHLKKINYSFSSNELNIQELIGDNTPAAFNDYLAIVNIIIKNGKLGKGDVPKDDLLNLVDLVASKLNSTKPGKASHLYQYLSGNLNEYDTTKVQSTVMKNFIAFVFNPDSIERMEGYLTAKQIPEKWMAYTFWSAFNGFANLSRIFVASYFETSNRDITDPIDQYFSKYHKNEMQTQVEEIKEIPAHEQDNIEKTRENRQAKIEDFYNEFINGKFKLSLAQFEQIASLEDPEKMVTELKAKHRIAKKDGVKLIDRFRDLVKAPSLF
jgi:hypothetical protein